MLGIVIMVNSAVPRLRLSYKLYKLLKHIIIFTTIRHYLAWWEKSDENSIVRICWYEEVLKQFKYNII